MPPNDEETPLISKPKPTPFPWRPISILFMLNTVTPLAFELIFPFINQMLLELHVVDDPERVGFYSGVIESVFSLMSLLTILPSSYAADRFGRKPVILFGMTGLAVSLVCFGLSRSFLTLIISRCLGGALGGIWTTVKIMVGELTDRSNQNIGFQGLTITYRMGQIIGLPLGGFLAHPERDPILGKVFYGPFWQKYPFVLPCLVGAGFAVLAVILGCIFLEETLLSKKKKSKSNSSPARSPSPTFRTVAAVPGVSDELDAAVAESRSRDADNASVNGTEESDTLINMLNEKEESPSFMSVLTSDVVALMVSNLVMCLCSEALFSVYPLFAFTPISSGGLGFSEAQIGAHLSIRAAMHVAAMFLFSPIHTYLGRTSPVRLYQFVMTLWPLCVLFYPLLNYMARGPEGPHGWAFNSAVFIFFIVWSFAGFCWTCMGIMVNDASPSAAALATINGVVQMSIVLPQAIAPAFTTSLFAYSVENDVLGGNLIWVVFLVLTCAGTFQALFIREPQFDWRTGSESETTMVAGSSSSTTSTAGVLLNEDRN